MESQVGSGQGAFPSNVRLTQDQETPASFYFSDVEQHNSEMVAFLLAGAPPPARFLAALGLRLGSTDRSADLLKLIPALGFPAPTPTLQGQILPLMLGPEPGDHLGAGIHGVSDPLASSFTRCFPWTSPLISPSPASGKGDGHLTAHFSETLVS